MRNPLRFFDPAVRYHRLARRAALWESAGITTPSRRLQAWLDLLVLDHGFLRLLYPNRHRVSAELWRSGQPTPWDLRRLKARGLRTVISIRGGRALGMWLLEREACEQLELTLVELDIRAREPPGREALLRLIEALQNAEYPALIHCKSGADRTGLGVALYLLLRGDRSFPQAAAQLSAKYGHFRASRAGVLSAVLDAYRREGHEQGIDLRHWAQSIYDPEAIARSFRTRTLASRISDAFVSTRSKLHPSRKL